MALNIPTARANANEESCSEKRFELHIEELDKRREFSRMSTAPKVLPQPVIIGFFVIGLLSSVAFRAIIVLQKLKPGWVRPVWYFGVIGYTAFFIYRYYISFRRKRAIAQSNVIEKIRTGETLTQDDRDAALYLLNSIRKSQEDWNYLAIFVLSVIAVVLDLIIPGKH